MMRRESLVKCTTHSHTHTHALHTSGFSFSNLQFRETRLTSREAPHSKPILAYFLPVRSSCSHRGTVLFLLPSPRYQEVSLNTSLPPVVSYTHLRLISRIQFLLHWGASWAVCECVFRSVENRNWFTASIDRVRGVVATTLTPELLLLLPFFPPPPSTIK